MTNRCWSEDADAEPYIVELREDILERARAGADPDVAALLGGIAVSVHNGDREGEPTDPLAECAGCEKVWFVDFHD